MKKKVWIIVAVCLLIIFAGFFALTTGKAEKRQNRESALVSEDRKDETEIQEKTPEAPEETVSPDSSVSGKEQKKAGQGKENGQEDSAAGDITDNDAQENSLSIRKSENEGQTEEKEGAENIEAEAPISFPHTVSGTSLAIENISSYDGIFLEDGSDQEVSGIAAMLLRNTGDANVEYAQITLKRDGEELQFEASDIPAGAAVVVQEKNKAAYGSGTFTDCSGITAELDSFEMSEDKVRVEETEEGSLQVTNLIDEEIPGIRIFYKFYMEDQQSYVGGITYTAKLTNLEAGSSQTVMPSHYVAGSSQVLMVRTYDAAE